MPLSVRAYERPHCGLVMERDPNASKAILSGAGDGMAMSFQKPLACSREESS